MPLFFNNIRNANSSNTLTIGFWYNDPIVRYIVNYQVVVSISDAIYNNNNSLINTINTVISTNIATYHGLTAVFSVSNNNYISLTTNCY